jgi:hypothetical protein
MPKPGPSGKTTPCGASGGARKIARQRIVCSAGLYGIDVQDVIDAEIAGNYEENS